MPECHKPFLGHCDLDLWPHFQELLCPELSPILFDVGIPNLGWLFLLGWRSGAYHFESLWPWHWLLASFLVFSCYITAIFPQMCLILDQFLWGHSSRVCDISCLSGFHLRPYFVYASRIGSGEVVARQWDKVPKLNHCIELRHSFEPKVW